MQSYYKRKGIMTSERYYLLLKRYEVLAKKQQDGMDKDTWRDFNKISEELNYYLTHSIEDVEKFILCESERANRRSSVSMYTYLRHLNAINHGRKFLLSGISQRMPISEKDFRNTYFKKKRLRKSVFI